MKLEKMIAIERSESIKNLFVKFTRTKLKITLWQNIDNVHRIWKQVLLKKYDLHKDELIFYPRKGMFEFNSKLPIYFYANKKTTIFKDAIYYNSKLNLVLKTPKNLMLENARYEEREQMKKGETEYVKLFYGKDIRGNRESWFKSVLLDRSVGGFSFKSSLNNVIKFQEGQRLEFQFETMSEFKKGEISNISTFISEDLSEKYYRVGVKILTE